MTVIDLTQIEARRRSVSQLNTYLTCSEQYRLQRREKVPQKEAAWFQMGTAVHHVIEQWELWGRQGTIEQAKAMYWAEYDRLIEEAITASGQAPADWLTGSKKPGGQDIEDRRARGADHVERYIEHALGHADEWRIATINQRPAVEVEFDITLGGVQVKGYIDQVIETRDGLILPRDLKTGTKIPESPLQLAVYADALNTLWGYEVTSGAYVMTKNQWDKMEHYEPLNAWTHDILSLMFQRFDIAERAGLYVPNVGSHCRVCVVKDYCPIMGSSENK